jgi:hypothetical protein
VTLDVQDYNTPPLQGPADAGRYNCRRLPHRGHLARFLYTAMMSCDRDGFREQVRAQMCRLENKDLKTIEREVIAKRTDWFDNQAAADIRAATTTSGPRLAFETVFFRYMGLRPEELPVLYENNDEIVWSSRNPCPTLEACRQLGLDTRVVCRGAYEKSTQALVSRMDPQLRFLRDYHEIRPVSYHCLERIVRVQFEEMMGLAIEEARQSRREGNKGYGAVAVLGTRVITRANELGTKIRSVDIQEPNLEAVFLQLTGRALRD